MLSAVKYLFANTKGLVGRFIVFFLLFSCNMIVAFNTPFVIKDFSEELLNLENINQIFHKGLTVAVYTLAFYVIKWLIMFLKLETSTLLAFEIRTDVYKRVTEDVDIKDFRQKGPSYFSQVIGYDVNMICLLFEQGLTILVETVSAILTSVALFYINKDLAILVLCFAPLYWYILKTMYKKAGENMNNFFQQRVSSYKVTNDFVFGMLDMRISQSLNWMREKYVKVQKKYLSFIMKMAIYMTFSTSSTEFILTCMQVLVIVVGVQFLNGGNFSIPMLLAFLTMMNRLYQPLITWCANSLNMQQGLTGYSRLKEILEQVEIQKDKLQLSSKKLELVLSSISFGHEDTQLILKQVNLHVKPGEWVIILGPSGSGKSTLLEIAAGLTKPLTGQVLYNSVEVQRLDSGLMHSIVAVVTEEMYFVEGNLYDNVAYTLPVDEDIIRLILMEVKLDNLLLDANFVIKRDGSNLSVGQKQRLALARALYRNPQILLLDEPTSALDYESEQTVIEALKSRKGMSVLMATHRTNLLKYADQVYSVSSGELARESVV